MLSQLHHAGVRLLSTLVLHLVEVPHMVPHGPAGAPLRAQPYCSR